MKIVKPNIDTVLDILEISVDSKGVSVAVPKRDSRFQVVIVDSNGNAVAVPKKKKQTERKSPWAK